MYGMRCGQVLDGIERGSMQRLRRRLDHEHRHECGCDGMQSVRGGQVLDSLECGVVHRLRYGHVCCRRRLIDMRCVPCEQVSIRTRQIVLLGVCCGLDHRHGLGGRSDCVCGMRCGQILDGIERGVVL